MCLMHNKMSIIEANSSNSTTNTGTTENPSRVLYKTKINKIKIAKNETHRSNKFRNTKWIFELEINWQLCDHDEEKKKKKLLSNSL